MTDTNQDGAGEMSREVHSKDGMMGCMFGSLVLSRVFFTCIILLVWSCGLSAFY